MHPYVNSPFINPSITKDLMALKYARRVIRVDGVRDETQRSQGFETYKET